MTTIIIPVNTSSASEELPSGYKSYSIPSSLTMSGKISLYSEQLQAVVSKEIDLQRQIEDLKKSANETVLNFNESSNRNIEIIGVFSSVIALLILNIGIITIANTFLKAVLFIVALTASLSLFAILIHSFFNRNNERKLNKSFWLPFSLLIALLLLGIATEIFNWSVLKDISPKIQKEQVINSTNATE
jgi:hypothetical protein